MPRRYRRVGTGGPGTRRDRAREPGGERLRRPARRAVRFPLEVAAREAYEVAFGDDPDELAVLDDGEASELVRLEERGRLCRRRLGRDGLDFLLHEHLDGDVAGHVLDLLLLGVAVADPGLEDAP